MFCFAFLLHSCGVYTLYTEGHPMLEYEAMESAAMDEGIDIDYRELKATKGLLLEDGTMRVIQISPKVSYAERACLIAEELGHHFTSAGNTVIRPDPIRLSRSEERAFRYAVRTLLPFDRLVDALAKAPRMPYELAEDLQVTEDFLRRALAFWEQTYGLIYECDEYVILFCPLGVYDLRNPDRVFTHFVE